MAAQRSADIGPHDGCASLLDPVSSYYSQDCTNSQVRGKRRVPSVSLEVVLRARPPTRAEPEPEPELRARAPSPSPNQVVLRDWLAGRRVASPRWTRRGWTSASSAGGERAG